MRIACLAAIVSLAAFSMGCWVEPAPQRTYRDPPPTAAEPTPGTPPAETPRIAIGTDRTLHVAPGEGAGVFVTYASGGRWTIAWTCDTKVSPGSTCPVEIAVGTHGMTDLATIPSGIVDGRDDTSFRVRTTTTTTIDSVTFATEPGAAIALSVRLRGRPYPSLVFFVHDGKLSTAPTDPIELVPTEP